MEIEDWHKRKNYLQKLLINLIGGFPKKRTPLNPRIVEQIDEGSYIREKVVYETEPGEIVPAYLLIPKKLKGKTPAVFVHHQHGGQFHIGKSEVIGRAGHPDQAYAKELAELGYIAFAPDAKCFEERVLFGLEGGHIEYYEGMRLILLGECLQRRMIWDVIRGIDYLLTRKEVDGNRIGCIGHSLGGQETLYASALDPRIKAAVSSCGFSTYKAILRNKVTHNLALYIPGLLRYTDTPEIASMIAPRPFLILTGSKDGSFPLDGVQEVYNKARKIYRLYGADEKLKLVINNIGHGSPDPTREEAYAWFDKWLRHSKN